MWRAWLALHFVLALAVAGMPTATAYWQSRAQVSIAAATFQGAGDVVSGAIAWGSCARAYNAAYANGTNPLCDLVDATTGTVAICTLRAATTGFVDLTGNYCTGTTTPALACAAAAGGSCKISKAYDQTGTGNHFTQATAANMPALTFSALNSLPGMTFAAGSGTLATANVTQAQPLTLSAVGSRTGANTTETALLATNGSGTPKFGPTSIINTWNLSCPTTLNATASDGSFHAAQGVCNGVSSALIVDGSATTGDAGATGYSAQNIRIARFGAAATLTGVIMEVGIWPSAFNATQYGNVNTNQHSAANGYNF